MTHQGMARCVSIVRGACFGLWSLWGTVLAQCGWVRACAPAGWPVHCSVLLPSPRPAALPREQMPRLLPSPPGFRSPPTSAPRCSQTGRRPQWQFTAVFLPRSPPRAGTELPTFFPPLPRSLFATCLVPTGDHQDAFSIGQVASLGDHPCSKRYHYHFTDAKAKARWVG